MNNLLILLLLLIIILQIFSLELAAGFTGTDSGCTSFFLIHFINFHTGTTFMFYTAFSRVQLCTGTPGTRHSLTTLKGRKLCMHMHIPVSRVRHTRTHHTGARVCIPGYLVPGYLRVPSTYPGMCVCIPPRTLPYGFRVEYDLNINVLLILLLLIMFPCS